MFDRILVAVAVLLLVVGLGGYALFRRRARKTRDRRPFNPFE